MPQRKILGCSFPVVIIVAVVLLVLAVIAFLGGPIGSKLPVVGGLIHLPSWLTVQQPRPELPPETVFHLGPIAVTNSMLTVWISIIVILLVSIIAFSRTKLVPRGLQAPIEALYTALLSFCQSVAGEKYGRKFFPIVATIFVFVLVNALMGLIPGYGSIVVHEGGKDVPLLRPANTDVNVPLAIALFSFVAVEYYGLRTLGFRYLGKFINTRQLRGGVGHLARGKVGSALGSIFFGAIDVFVGLLEGLSELIRIVSFTFRLFGNMTAGEILLLVVGYLVPLVVSLPFYGLELMVGLIQALIFGGLTLVFMTLAVASHDEEHAH